MVKYCKWPQNRSLNYLSFDCVSDHVQSLAHCKCLPGVVSFSSREQIQGSQTSIMWGLNHLSPNKSTYSLIPQPSLGVTDSCEYPKHFSSCTQGMEGGQHGQTHGSWVRDTPQGFTPWQGLKAFWWKQQFQSSDLIPLVYKLPNPLCTPWMKVGFGGKLPFLWGGQAERRGERSGPSSAPRPDPLFRRCLCWWQMVMLSWWICYLLDDMQYVCILTVRGETPAVPPVIDSKELFSLLTELRSISIILATRRGFIIMFIIWGKSLWCGTGWVFVFFLLLCSCSHPLLTLQTVTCSSRKERGGNLGPGHCVPKRAPLPSRWWKWQNPTFFLLKQWGRQERKDCFRVMKVQKVKQEVLSCFLHAWCLLKSLLTGRVWVTSSALWKREIILFFCGF